MKTITKILIIDGQNIIDIQVPECDLKYLRIFLYFAVDNFFFAESITDADDLFKILTL